MLSRFFPFLDWWPRVDRASLRADFMAALIGAVIVLPQGVAFATLAGLPVQYGLYAAMVPAVIAALWGSSRHLVSGPTNATSLVVFATLSHLATPGSERYVALALTLGLMVGLIKLVMGLARLGQLVNFISHTVIVGFTAGAAVLIVISQTRNFFGVPMPQGATPFEAVGAFAAHAGSIRPWVLLVSLLTLLVGVAARRWLPKLPYMIVAMIAGSLLAWFINREVGIEASGIATIGELPGALPPLSMPVFDADSWRRLFAIAIAVTAIGLTEAVSISRSIATRSGQRLDTSQEFIGQGLANIVGAFFSSYPASGSFNRSGANYEAGARTPLAAALSAPILVAVLYFVAPLAAYLPTAAMAAILMLVAWGLFDFRQIGVIVKSSRSETAVLLVTFVATLVLHLEMAIVAGVLLSLLLYLNKTSKPSLRSLLPDPNDASRRFVQRPSGAPECPQLKILRVEGVLYFGAANHLAEYLHRAAEKRPQQKHLLLMARSMNFVDISGAELLAAEAKARRARGGRLWFHGLREGALEILRQPAFAGVLADGALRPSKRDAIATIFGCLDRDICARCTARVFEECRTVPGPIAAPAAEAAAPAIEGR